MDIARQEFNPETWRELFIVAAKILGVAALSVWSFTPQARGTYR